MEDYQTISWIFLATAMASEVEPTDFAGISMLADAINHANPTQKELQTSIKWLTINRLIVKTGNKYSLTESGKKLYSNAGRKSNIVSKLWKDLEVAISEI
jgi:Mn-dependent DtxR family transcriptional regulator